MFAPLQVLGVAGGTCCRVTYANGDEVEYTVIVLGCEVIGVSPLSDANDETKRLEWFSPDEMTKLSFSYPTAVFDDTQLMAYFEWK